MTSLAVSFTASGLHGTLQVLAVLLFLIGALIAVFTPRIHWAVAAIAAGLCLATFALLVSG